MSAVCLLSIWRNESGHLQLPASFAMLAQRASKNVELAQKSSNSIPFRIIKCVRIIVQIREKCPKISPCSPPGMCCWCTASKVFLSKCSSVKRRRPPRNAADHDVLRNSYQCVLYLHLPCVCSDVQMCLFPCFTGGLAEAGLPLLPEMARFDFAALPANVGTTSKHGDKVALLVLFTERRLRIGSKRALGNKS